MANLNNIQSQLSRDTVYSRLSDRSFEGDLETTLIMESTYQRRSSSSIQIALDFYSDDCEWVYVGNSALGDCEISNVGNSADKSSYSKAKIFESATAQTNHKIRCISNSSNGFYPNIIYVGNHNMDRTDYIIFRAYNDAGFTSEVYSQRIDSYQKEVFYVNKRQLSKYKYYELEFVVASKVLQIGRIILAGSLPTTELHNPQDTVTSGFKDHKDEMMTESLTRLFNRQFWGKKLNFSIRINLEDSYKLADNIEKLILEGTGSRAFLVILNPRDPNYKSIYGVLTQEANFEHDQLKYGYYSFDIDEIE